MSRDASLSPNNESPGRDGRVADEAAPSTAPMSDTHASGDRLSQRSADFGLASDRSETGPDPLIGVDLDGVRIERFLGQGGMGRVYVARQTHPARAVAVKVMLAPLLGTAMVQRFRREADALARLRHPGIAQIFMAGCHRGGVVEVPYYVMELIPDAATLVQSCERRSLPIRERLVLLLAVCEAVAHGHAEGVVHRDLKPGNILVDASGRPKIIDFGIARMSDADTGAPDGGPRTETGQCMGTRPYMAPEQFADGRSAIDARTDVYALGVVMHELLTGRLPYSVAGKSLVETARIVQKVRPARLVTGVARGADQRLVRGADLIAGRCLLKNPAARYASAAAVADDLRCLLGGETIPNQRMQYLLPHGLKWVVLWCRHRPASVAASAVLIAAGLAALVVGMASLAWSPKDVPPATAGLAAGVETSSSDGPTAPASRGAAGSAAVPSRNSSREIRLSPLEEDWDRYVVSIEDAERYTEQHAGGTTFIRPTEAGREAAVTMRFEMPFVIQNAMLTAPLAVWTTGDPFPYDPGARAALDVSPNGEAWTTVAELKAGAGGVNTAEHDIGRIVAGGTKIWVRARLTATREWPGDGLIFAQFLRTDPTQQGAVFRLTATGTQPAQSAQSEP